MIKFWFGMVALIVSLTYIGVAVLNHGLAQDLTLVYVSIVATFLLLAHLEDHY